MARITYPRRRGDPAGGLVEAQHLYSHIITMQDTWYRQYVRAKRGEKNYHLISFNPIF